MQCYLTIFARVSLMSKYFAGPGYVVLSASNVYVKLEMFRTNVSSAHKHKYVSALV